MKKNHLVKVVLIFGIVSSLSLGCEANKGAGESASSSPTASPTTSASPRTKTTASPTASPTPSPSATTTPSGNTKSDDLSQLLKTSLKPENLKKWQDNQAYSNNLMLWIAIVLTVFVLLKFIEIIIEFFREKRQIHEEDIAEIKTVLQNFKTQDISNNLEKIESVLTRINTALENPKDTNIAENLKEIQSVLTQINTALANSEDTNIAENLKEIQSVLTEINTTLVNLKDTYIHAITPQSRENTLTSKITGETSSSDISNSLVLTDEENQVISHYNDGTDLSQWTTEVSPTQDTVEEARTGREQIVHLTPDSAGMYWIITVPKGTYLVPNRRRKPNTHQMKAGQDLFECRNYQTGTTNPQNFKLVKPGKVDVETPGKTWVLREKGILEFQ